MAKGYKFLFQTGKDPDKDYVQITSKKGITCVSCGKKIDKGQKAYKWYDVFYCLSCKKHWEDTDRGRLMKL